MPVAGDDRYGDREFNRTLRKTGLNRLFLHASRLKFQHPVNKETVQVDAPLPDDLNRVLERLGIDTVPGTDQE
jgi:23S rRNA pseudouridine955/2504/2580 synthase